MTRRQSRQPASNQKGPGGINLRFKSRRRLRAALCGVSATCLIALGAGSVGAQTGTTPGVTDDSIKIGGITTLTSPTGYSQPGIEKGFQARIERENDAGGIHGRTIDFIGMKDDNFSASRDLEVARELVQQDEVFLVAPFVTPFSVTGGEFLVEQGVPFVGWGVTPSFCGNDVGFGYDGCLFPTEPGSQVSTMQGGVLKKLMKQEGKKPKGATVAMQGEDIPAARVASIQSAAAFDATGFDVVYQETNVPIGPPPQWDPYVQAILTSDNSGEPDAVYIGMTLQNALGLTGALRNAGYDGIIMSPLYYDQAVVDNPSARQAADGSYAFLNYAPIEERTSATKQLVKDVRQYIGKDTIIDYQIEVGYWVGDAVVEMLKAAGEDLTRESFLATANKITVGMKGGYGPTTFPKDHDTGGACGAMVLVDGDKFVPKVPFQCYPTTELQA